MAALFALLLVLAALRPLALPDEGRYGEVGRWMAVSGDWLVPRLNGLPFFHKPPLLYWLEAASVTLLGATPWALRLVPALHAGLMLVGLFLAARARGRHIGNAAGGERLARRAALMFGTSPAFLLGGQYINHDMMVAAWISVAIGCFAAAFLRGGKPHTGWALAGFAACALGVLSKGLIGVVLPGLVLFIWLLWTRQFGKVWRLPWLRGLLLFAVIAVPWFVLVERRVPGVFAYLFGVQQFTRYVGHSFNNAWPWWF
jgi:4-amino-4-deoxy-L-arabinose transferase-like glycosyltransferase